MVSYSTARKASQFNALDTLSVGSAFYCNLWILKDLTWLLSVPNLTHLELECLEKVQEEIISEEKKVSSSVTRYEYSFSETWEACLDQLTEVEEYWSPLLFPCLKKIEVEKCPKLRKLPLSFKSCVGGEELVINYRDDKWFKRVRWEDKATKDRFLPCCEKVCSMELFITIKVIIFGFSNL